MTNHGTIITFYSYKGGTGRTMALANTAWIMASNGYKVLVVDWDLEAPGLHTYLHPLLSDPDLTESPGVIEMVREFAKSAMAPVGSGADNGAAAPGSGDGALDELWYRERARVDRYVLGTDLSLPPGGRLDLLPAGVQDDSTYAATISTFNWGAFYEKGGGAFLTALREDMASRYDYVLIDSRTGLSDTAGICTVIMPDIVVDCFTLSRQGVSGAVHVAESIRRQAHHRDIRIMPVPMRVEDAGQDKLEAGRYQARNLFATFLGWMPPEEQERYWGDVEIPYKPSYAYEEIPATVGERRQEGTLLAAFERLTSRITEGRVTQLGHMDERSRLALHAKYQRTSPTVPKDIFISYAPDDRMWAEWVATTLSGSGYQTTLVRASTDAATGAPTEIDRALAGASRVLAVLSPSYVRLPQSQAVWEQITRQDPSGALRMLVPVRVDEAQLPQAFLTVPPINVAGATAEEAETRLLNAVDALDGNPVGQAARRASATRASGTRLPGTIPPVMRVPQRNAAFTGRSEVIERLRDSLLRGTAAVLPQALYGLGGVGKTQVALEYVHRFAADYDVVWWINAEQPHLIRQELADLAPRLGLPSGTDVTVTSNAVLEALRRGDPYKRWLLVYDNAEQSEDLAGLTPSSAPGHHILITSRNPAWAQRAVPVEVDLFSREESVSLLRRYNQVLTEDEADLVAGELGDLPLAVGQAAAWLQESRMPIDTYLQLLRTQLTEILDNEPAAEYPRSAAATWRLSIEELQERLPAAAELMKLCAFFGSDPIPMHLLNSPATLDLLAQHDPGLRNPLLMSRLYREVNRYGLARIDQSTSTITVHRLVQAVLRDQLSPEEQQEKLHRVHTILASANPKDPDASRHWDKYGQLLPHLWPTRAETSTDPEVRQWICDSVRYLWMRGDNFAAEQTAQRTLGRWTADHGEEDDLVLWLQIQLATALREQGRLVEAHDLDREVHDTAMRVLGQDHPYTLSAAMNLGADLRGAGKFGEAVDMDKATLPLATAVFGEEHPRALSAANNLAVSQYLNGDREAARDLDRDTWRKREQILGLGERYTMLSRIAYARDLRDLGDLQGALKIAQETPGKARESLGPHHIYALRAAKDLGILLRRSGRHEEAYALTKETYESCRTKLGADHPETLATATSLAADLVERGETTEGRTLAERTLGRYRELHGEEHPFTLACATNLAVYLRLTGEPQAALELSQRTLELYRRLLGDKHPYTLTCMINHATDLAAVGDSDSAAVLGREAYEGLVATLGPRHFHTIAGTSNLAIDLRNTGAEEEARGLHGEAEERAREVLGGEHALTRSVTAWRRVDTDIEPPAT